MSIKSEPRGIFKREGFATSLGVLTATLGSAVGLGNIWKFPSMTGQNGGAAFLFLYILCVLFIGLIVMVSEFIIGRKAQANCVSAYKKLSPGKPWYLSGIVGVIAAYVIMFFYTDVAGWVYSYIFKAALGAFHGIKPADTGNVFNAFVTSPYASLIWQWIVLVLVSIIIIAGVTKGIERITKTLLPILFILLVICDIRSLTLSGAMQGVSFLFKPDLSKITWSVVLAALGLSFFKLSVGMGTMTTYGSYIGKDENITNNAIRVVVADTFISILAGLAIFPAVFHFGFKPEIGASLLFVTIPAVFNQMPFGQFFMTIFFLLTAIAATGAMMSLLEVPVAYLTEEHNWKRPIATIVSAVLMGVVGITATLSTSTMAAVKPFGKTFFDLFDFVSSNILLPVGGILICIYAGWVIGKKGIMDEASNNGRLHSQGFIKFYTFVVRYVAPIAIFIVLLGGLNAITPIVHFFKGLF
jgi:NSS family neurotransmitter:Na+ symporter